VKKKEEKELLLKEFVEFFSLLEEENPFARR